MCFRQAGLLGKIKIIFVDTFHLFPETYDFLAHVSSSSFHPFFSQPFPAVASNRCVSVSAADVSATPKPALFTDLRAERLSSRQVEKHYGFKAHMFKAEGYRPSYSQRVSYVHSPWIL